MPDSFLRNRASLGIEQGSQTRRHPLSIDTPSTLSPVRLSVQGGQNQPEPTPGVSQQQTCRRIVLSLTPR